MAKHFETFEIVIENITFVFNNEEENSKTPALSFAIVSHLIYCHWKQDW